MAHANATYEKHKHQPKSRGHLSESDPSSEESTSWGQQPWWNWAQQPWNWVQQQQQPWNWVQQQQQPWNWVQQQQQQPWNWMQQQQQQPWNWVQQQQQPWNWVQQQQQPWNWVQQQQQQPWNWNQSTALNYDPAIYIKDEEANLNISVELPGMNESNLSVTLQDDILVIKGEKPLRFEVKEDLYFAGQVWFGKFKSLIKLGFVPEAKQIAAHFEEGILNLNIKKPQNLTKKESIKVSSEHNQYMHSN